MSSLSSVRLSFSSPEVLGEGGDVTLLRGKSADRWLFPICLYCVPLSPYSVMETFMK